MREVDLTKSKTEGEIRNYDFKNLSLSLTSLDSSLVRGSPLVYNYITP